MGSRHRRRRARPTRDRRQQPLDPVHHERQSPDAQHDPEELCRVLEGFHTLHDPTAPREPRAHTRPAAVTVGVTSTAAGTRPAGAA